MAPQRANPPATPLSELPPAKREMAFDLLLQHDVTFVQDRRGNYIATIDVAVDPSAGGAGGSTPATGHSAGMTRTLNHGPSFSSGKGSRTLHTPARGGSPHVSRFGQGQGYSTTPAPDMFASRGQGGVTPSRDAEGEATRKRADMVLQRLTNVLTGRSPAGLWAVRRTHTATYLDGTPEPGSPAAQAVGRVASTTASDLPPWSGGPGTRHRGMRHHTATAAFAGSASAPRPSSSRRNVKAVIERAAARFPLLRRLGRDGAPHARDRTLEWVLKGVDDLLDARLAQEHAADLARRKSMEMTVERLVEAGAEKKSAERYAAALARSSGESAHSGIPGLSGVDHADFESFLIDFMRGRYGIRSLTERAIWELLANVEAHRDAHRAVDTLASFLDGRRDFDDFSVLLYARNVVFQEASVRWSKAAATPTRMESVRRARLSDVAQKGSPASVMKNLQLRKGYKGVHADMSPQVARPAHLRLTLPQCLSALQTTFGDLALGKALARMLQRHFSTAKEHQLAEMGLSTEDVDTTDPLPPLRIACYDLLALILTAYHDGKEKNGAADDAPSGHGDEKIVMDIGSGAPPPRKSPAGQNMAARRKSAESFRRTTHERIDLWSGMLRDGVMDACQEYVGERCSRSAVERGLRDSNDEKIVELLELRDGAVAGAISDSRLDDIRSQLMQRINESSGIRLAQILTRTLGLGPGGQPVVGLEHSGLGLSKAEAARDPKEAAYAQGLVDSATRLLNMAPGATGADRRVVALCRGVLGLKAIRREVEPYTMSLIAGAVALATDELKAKVTSSAGMNVPSTPTPDTVGQFVADRLDDASTFIEPESGMTPMTPTMNSEDSGVTPASPADADPRGNASGSAEEAVPEDKLQSESTAEKLASATLSVGEDAGASDGESSGADSVVEK